MATLIKLGVSAHSQHLRGKDRLIPGTLEKASIA